MQAVKTDKVRKVFYKDGTERPKWKMFDLDEIMDLAELVVPNNKYEIMYVKNILRQVIYSIMDYEKNQHGRLLISVKHSGKPVIYGFTKKKEYLLNFVQRTQQRMINQKKKLKENGMVVKGLLPDKQLSLFS